MTANESWKQSVFSMYEANTRRAQETPARIQTSLRESWPAGSARPAVRGFRPSISSSISLLNDMPAVRPAARASETHTQVMNSPPPAKSTPSQAKGSAKSVSTIMIRFAKILKFNFMLLPSHVHGPLQLVVRGDPVGPVAAQAIPRP